MLMERPVNMSPPIAIATADVAHTKVFPYMPAQVNSDSTALSASPMSSAALRTCLDLLVKAQRTQSESVAMLHTLNERFFPSPAGREDSPSPAVPFDDADRSVVRLRVAEAKLSGLRPRISAAIDGAMSPFRSYLRSEAFAFASASASASVSVSVGHPLWEACRRVGCLRDQLMGLAQLQEEAMRSLGAQLSTLFLRPRGGGNALYYYPSAFGTHDTHDAVREFLQQLLDVMSSKQHIVVCLATALREIYDPAVAAMSSPGDEPNARDNPSATRCISLSVSVSPLSTAARGVSRSPSAVRQLSVALAAECHRNPSPRKEKEEEEEERGVSPASGSPRSPSFLRLEANASPPCAPPPPPLAMCPRDQTLTLPAEAREWSSAPKAHEGQDSLAHSGNTGEPEERCGVSDDFAVRAENARLREMLDAKDRIILQQQSQLLGIVPALVERAESSCSCRSTSTNTRPASRDSSVAPRRSVERDTSESPQLRDALQVAREEKMHWKRAARALTAENKALRTQLQNEQDARARLQANLVHLKKQCLTAEASGRIDSAPLSLAMPSISRSQSHERSERNDLHLNHSGFDGGFDETPPGHNRSRTQTPPPQRERQKHPKEQTEEDPPIAAASSSSSSSFSSSSISGAALRAKRSALFAKLRRVPAEAAGPEEDPIVIVSPLTEERRPLPAGALPAGALPAGALPATARRLSPEYRSPPRRQSPHSVVPAAEVDRILSSARGLLRSLRSGTATGGPATAHTTSSDMGSDSKGQGVHSSLSNVSWRSNDSVDIAHNGPSALESSAVPLVAMDNEDGTTHKARRSISPANGALSPCSSISYSAAKRRGIQSRPGVKPASPSMPISTQGNPSPQKPTTITTTPPTTPKQPQQQEGQKQQLEGSRDPRSQQWRMGDQQPTRGRGDGGRGGIATTAKARPGTARESLMRELREQLSLLRGQHAAVLRQAEQLRVKRQQVTAAFQRRIQESAKGGGDTAKLRGKLTSYLVRFDTTQSKVQQNEARVRESAEIVERQLQTLEDDLF